MKTSSACIAALVSALSVTSICTADAFTEGRVTPTTEAKTQVSTAQSAVVNFLVANWRINDDGQGPVPVDMLTQNSANYFDNNWALPRDSIRAYPTSEVTYARLNQHGSVDSKPID